MTTPVTITAEVHKPAIADLKLFEGGVVEMVLGGEVLTGVNIGFTVDKDIAKIAMISECETYRYLLMRAWDLSLPMMVFVMLNPSTADATLDDPTIRRCMGFARRDGYGGIIVVNLFAYRSPSPEVMKAAVDPEGPLNTRILQHIFEYAVTSKAPVIAGWGVHGDFKDQDYGVVQQAEITGVEFSCLGKSKGGHPRHPLYLKGDAGVVALREAV